jgi:membrane protease YdiL (CAAX protease family)
MEGASLTPPPPDLPERPDGVERGPGWPWWFAIAGFVAGLFGTAILVGMLAAILGIASDDESSTFVVVATLAQAAVFVITAIAFAGMVAKPKAWHFGLVRTRFWPAIGWATLGVVAFYVFTAAYSPLVPEDVEQNVTEDLGAEDSTLGLIAAGVMVMVVAPFAEEFFFRGFFYRALRSRMPVIAAALVDGLLFGVIHYNFEGADALLLLPPLALLGFLFCLVYEKTGSLFPVIGMHAFNNAVAYGAQADDGWQVSVVVGPLVLAACMLAPRFFRPAERPAPA